jgi:DNA-binding GntR family transcriptional regulator
MTEVPELESAMSRCSLSDEAYRALKRLIVSVRLPPGAHVTEAQISAELLLGKTPVREALARLQREELVECIPRSGYRVTPLTLKDVHELFAVRVLIEGEAARLASGRDLGDERIERLRELCHLSFVAGDQEGFDRAIALNTEFHLLLAEGSGNAKLAGLLHQVMQHMERILHIGLTMTDAAELDYTREHPELLEAVLSGDGERSRALVEVQNLVWEDRITDILVSSEAVLSANLGPLPDRPHRLAQLPLAVAR